MFNILTFSDIERIFNKIMENDANVSAGIAAIRTLLTVLKEDKCELKAVLTI